MEPDELELRLAPGAVDPLAPLAAHRGPVRLAVDLDHAGDPGVRQTIAEARRRRGDVLLVYDISKRRRDVSPPPPALPLRCAGLIDRRGPRFDAFTEWAATRGMLAREALDLEALRRRPPHVLHVGHDADVEPITRILRLTRVVPAVVFLERRDGADVEPLRQLHDAGCAAIVAVTASATLDGAVELFYRKLAHDRPLDTIARELSPAHDVVLALAAGAETSVSLRRVMLEERQAGGFSAARAIAAPPRAPASELELLLAGQAAGAIARLARLRDGLATLSFDLEGHAADAIMQARDRVAGIVEDAGPALSWRLEPRPAPRDFESFGPGDVTSAVMPPRTLRALLHQGGVELARGVRAGEPFSLDASIGFVRREDEVQLPGMDAPIPLATLRRAFGAEDHIDLDLVVWSPPGELEVRCASPRLTLPRLGESPPVRFELVAAAPPGGAPEVTRRLRLAAYHQNALLQSLAIDVAVGRDHPPARAPEQVLDYVLSDELLTVDQAPPRRLSIFLNDGADGSHWIGARTEDDGALVDLGEKDAGKIATLVHDALRAASTLDKGDRYALPLGDIDAGDRADRAKRMVELAQAGHRMFTSLFGKAIDGGFKRLLPALGPPDGHIEIARCRGEAPALPWQLVYDLPLAQDAGAALCPSYVAQLAGAADLLDRPGDCARQGCCPHRALLGDGAPPDASAPPPRLTVCPFGFWGSRHRLAQPIALRRQGATAPPAVPAGDRGVTAGYFEFENAARHIAHVAPPGDASRSSTRDAKAFMELVARRRDAVIYLYCHGKSVDDELVLQVGSDDDAQPQYVRSGDLVDVVAHGDGWTHAPIVILNGCETLQVQPATLNDLLGVLRNLGAAAIIGPEIAMFTTSAARIGEAIVDGVLAGRPLDALMVAIRRALLRDLSPMGLAYNVYAPSGLAWRRPGDEVS